MGMCGGRMVWIPACAGMTVKARDLLGEFYRDLRLRGDDSRRCRTVVQVVAGFPLARG